MAQQVDWLGPFIEQELQAVVKWKRSRQNNTKSSTEKTRFSDDGSNFYSDAEAEQLPEDAKVQVLKMLTKDDVVIVLVSDGFTVVKALLSQDAVAILQDEIDDEVNEDTKGDVLAIREATVVSTPLGPPEGFIHLRIESVKYCHHLRKLHKTARAVEQVEAVRRLIDGDLTDVVNRQYAINEGTADEPYDLTNDEATTGGNDDVQTATRAARQALTPSQQSSRASQVLLARQSTSPSQGSKGAVATQISYKKPTGPNLRTDGLQMENGVNLQRPQGATFRSSPTARLPHRSPPKPVTVDSTTKHLLGLLGNKRVAVDPPHAPAPPAKSARFESPAAEAQLQGKHSSPPSRALAPQTSEGRTEAAPAPATPVPVSHPETAPQKSREAESTSDRVLATANDTPDMNGDSSATKQITLPTQQGKNQLGSTRRVHRPRPIPRDQQELLDLETSWIPAKPGKRFPHPNVPARYLQRWIAEAAAARQQAEPERRQAPDAPSKEAVEKESSSSDSASLSSSEEEDGEEEEGEEEEDSLIPGWEQTPTQRGKVLPPDSTMESNSQVSMVNYQKTPVQASSSQSNRASPSATQQRSNQVATQQSSAQDISQRSHNTVDVDRNVRSQTPRTWTKDEDARVMVGTRKGKTDMEIVIDYRMNRSPKDIASRRRVLLQKYPDEMAPTTPTKVHDSHSTDGRPSTSSSRHSAGDHSMSRSRTSDRYMPNPSWSRYQHSPPHNGPPPSSRRSSQRHNGSSVRRHSGHQLDGASDEVDVPVSSLRWHQTPVGQASDTVVKATPANGENEDDDMGMSVPRSLEEDPILAHRQKRREHFASSHIQRRKDWFSQIYTAYRKARPKDSVSPSALSEAIADIFPDTEPRRENSISQSNVGSSPPQATARRADLDGAADAPKVAQSGQPKHAPSNGAGPIKTTKVSMALAGSSAAKSSGRPSLFAQFASPSHQAIESTKVTPTSQPSRKQLRWTCEAEMSRSVSTSTLSASECQPFSRSGQPGSARHVPTAGTTPLEKQSNGTTSKSADGTMKSASRNKPHKRHTEPPEGASHEREGYFTEFVDSMKRLKPGGAFAIPKEQQKKPAGKKQFSVLSWEL
ncbi:uncharacterized protein LTR77_003668 [Saxophila tyrrhenica]|uniref:Shelterin complex subunit TPP1/Est3 domain-containing protein n=1 Tax=Saxophila tyrrhenica TaxID=1690608 RepID=A0AAV9PH56_9PEZI|nr:hypothetical protein LTR77_003668 [Saxophila tyrrhenica]